MRSNHSTHHDPLQDFCILVCSSDGYDDAWHPCFALLRKYWGELVSQIYLMTNDKTFDEFSVLSLNTPRTADWSTCLATALRKIPEKYVLVIMEDYFLDRPVRHDRIVDALRFIRDRSAACVHVYPDPMPDGETQPGFSFAENQPGQAFRVNLQAAIWDREVMLSLVREGESAWDFEVLGTQRALTISSAFYTVTEPAADAPFHYYQTGIVRGKWMPKALAHLRQEGLHPPRLKRPVGYIRGWVRDVPALVGLRRLALAPLRWAGRN